MICISRETFQIFVANCFLALCILPWGSSVHSQNQSNLGSQCGTLYSPEQYGPYDYRTDRGQRLFLVESAHFLPRTEGLLAGTNDRRPGPDLDYTLRAYPNHHRALLAMMRLSARDKTEQPYGSRYPIECWFERASVFRPDDTIVRMIYSTFLSKNGRVPDANRQLAIAITYAKDEPFTHYNIGLLYFDMKDYDKALAQAHKAIALGATQTELGDQLRKVGKWVEPAPLPAEPAEPAK